MGFGLPEDFLRLSAPQELFKGSKKIYKGSGFRVSGLQVSEALGFKDLGRGVLRQKMKLKSV